MVRSITNARIYQFNRFLLMKQSKRNYRISPYTLNDNYLDNGLVSHEHAWFWGFLLTDGHVRVGDSGNATGITWNQKYI